jgi:hypothetical protein
MAILVSNPSTVQLTGAPTEPQDPSVIPQDAGFTEELANAMQPSPQLVEGANLAQKQVVLGVDAKLNDLQILPPEVLLNAVGEANFAFAAQVAPASEEAVLTQDASAALTDPVLLNPLDTTQAAELVASALAAQMVTQVPVPNNAVLHSQVPVSTGAVASVGAAGAAGPVDAERTALGEGSQLGEVPTLQNASVVSQQPVLNPSSFANSLESSTALEFSAANASNLNLTQSIQETQIANQQSANASTQLAVATNVSGAPETLATNINASGLPQQLGSEASQQLLSSDSPSQSSVISSQSLNASASLTGQANQTPSNSVAASAAVLKIKAGEPGHLSVNSDGIAHQTASTLGIQPSAFDLAKSDVAQPLDLSTALPNQSKQTLPGDQVVASLQKDTSGLSGQDRLFINTSGNDTLTGAQMDSSIRVVPNEPLQNSKPEFNEEAAFKFDAKLGGQVLDEGLAQVAQLSKPVSLGGVQPNMVAGSISAPLLSQEAVAQGQLQANAGAVGASMAPSTQQAQGALNGSEVQSTITSASPISNVNSASSVSVKSSILNGSDNDTESEAKPLNAAAVKDNNSDSRWSQASGVNTRALDSETLNELMVNNANVQQVVEDNARASAAQAESPQSVAKSFSEVSSTFVSTLVGGPQRPITTVMDWVALKPQEPPRPVMPHELRLDAGAVQVEIQRMVKEGGGHVVMELTPPDQSKFTIELKLDDNGGAYLRVEGVSDSTKTRLEQSAPQLQEQFQQMGLNLQLDMRQNRDPSSSGSANGMPNEPGFDNNLPQEATAQTNRAVAAERAHNQNGGQVYLYA